jgi:hypothetical protein
MFAAWPDSETMDRMTTHNKSLTWRELSHNIITVAALTADFQFVSDSQDVQSIRDMAGIDPDREYDAFFVVVEDGDYACIFGMQGTVAHYQRNLYRLK